MPTQIRWSRLILFTLFSVISVAVFFALGLWQVHRLHWKLDLIERTDSRVNAIAMPAPKSPQWPSITTEKDEYKHVTLSGTFLNKDDVLIYTPSNYGPADWILTPLRRDDGTIVMVNRGVVPDGLARTGNYKHELGEVHVTGLLRISESKGWLFSRANNPTEGHWYRRDIGSITKAKGYKNAAPYFVDQELKNPNGWPRGGQTVVKFRNAHLEYALTWFALALVMLGGYGLVLRQELFGRRAM